MKYARSAGIPAALLAFAVLASGCGIFGGDKDEELEPRELVEFQQTLPVERRWNAKLGGGSELLRLALSPSDADPIDVIDIDPGALRDEVGAGLAAARRRR